MQDALKWTLRLRVEGLSLWLNRGKHIDVLFPNDGLSEPKHHFVTYSRGEPSGAVLTGVTLDFTTLAGSDPLLVGEDIGWLGLEIEAGSVASDVNAVFRSKGVLAALRLPLGTLSPMPEDRIGGFEFGGQVDVRLGYGVTWEMTVYGRRSIDVAWFEPATNVAKVVELGKFDPSSAIQEFRIRNLSTDDRGIETPVKPGEVMNEVQFLGYLTRADGKLLDDAPVFNPSGIPPAGGPAAGAGSAALLVYPARPCPPGYGRPF